MRGMRGFAEFCAIGVGLLGLTGADADAANAACPSGGTPAPGSTVSGGLTVDGRCELNRVPVNGGVTVAGPAGYVKVWNRSAVHGGLRVQEGGSAAVNADFDSGFPTGTPSTVNGGITMTSPFNVDISSAEINGRLTL